MKNTKNNKGFSLVELIVVLAIMAIMVGVLAPTLMRYVEKARITKDVSALGEVKNAINLAVAEESVFKAVRTASTGADAKGLAVDVKNGVAIAGNALATEVAKTISKVDLTSSGLQNATITFTATESNGVVSIAVKAEAAKDTTISDEAKTALVEAFGMADGDFSVATK